MAWWRDIKEIKEYVFILAERLSKVDCRVQDILERVKEISEKFDNEDVISCIEDSFSNVFGSDDEYNPINRIHDKLNVLVDNEEIKKEVLLSEKILDKFEDYMKNVDKLNAMVNEFKGCVSMARGALKTSKGKDTV